MNRKLLAKSINPCADSEEKFGKIRFIHKDGKEHCFYSAVNEMSGSRLSAFDSDAPTIDDSLGWVRSVFKDIRAKAQVLEAIGDF
jgi:hypothetical protein